MKPLDIGILCLFILVVNLLGVWALSKDVKRLQANLEDEKEPEDEDSVTNIIKSGIRTTLGIILNDREVEEIKEDIELRALALLERAEYESVIKDEIVYEGPYNLHMEVTLNRSMNCVFVNATAEGNQVDKVEFGFVFHLECNLSTAMIFNKEEENNEMV